MAICQFPPKNGSPSRAASAVRTWTTFVRAQPRSPASVDAVLVSLSSRKKPQQGPVRDEKPVRYISRPLAGLESLGAVAKVRQLEGCEYQIKRAELHCLVSDGGTAGHAVWIYSSPAHAFLCLFA